MASSIIGDAKYQELNMSFTFDEQQDKFIIKAIADHTPYELQLVPNPDLDFEDLKSVLLAKQFKLATKTPEILKLKIGVTFFEFKNIEKLTLNTLKQKFSEMSNKFEIQSQRNASLQATVNKMKVDFDLMTTKMADLSRMNDETREENLRMSNELSEVKKRENESQQKLDQMNNIVDKNREQASELRKMLKITEQKLYSITQVLSDKHEKKQEMRTILSDQNKNFSQALREKDSKEISLQSKRYNFSSQYKAKAISLSKDQSFATRQTWQTGQDFVLVEGNVNKKGSSIRFKIQSVKDFISGVGIAIRSLVVANCYQFKNRSHLGDGCFLICFGSWAFSHSNSSQNNVKTDFRLQTGDVIKVQTNMDQLLFWNETKKLEFKMKIDLTENEWKQVAFCATLLKDGHSISILNQ